MGSLSELLSSPLLDFVHSNNTERPDELDMLLETVSESDIHLLHSKVKDEELQPCHQPHQEVTTNDCVVNASDISRLFTCSGNTDPTSSTSLSNFATATENDLKQLKEKSNNKNTMKSTATWINRFETWQKIRGIANELENIPVNDLDIVLQSFCRNTKE